MPVEVKRAGKLEGVMAALRKRLGPKVERGLRSTAEMVLDISLPLVPQDTRALYDSGGVRQKGYGLKAVFIVGYGRSDFDPSPYGDDRMRRPPHEYAVYAHEIGVQFLKDPIFVHWSALGEAFCKGVQ